jgi:hypothetical protein
VSTSAPEKKRLGVQILTPEGSVHDGEAAMVIAPSVAVPTVSTAAVRTPASTTGAANGNRTHQSCCEEVAPIAASAATASGSARRTLV